MDREQRMVKGQPQDVKKAAAEADKIIKQLQEEQQNGVEKKKNKAAQKNKTKKPGQSKKGKGGITEEKVRKFFEVISKM